MFSPVRSLLCGALLLAGSSLYGAKAQPLPENPVAPLQQDVSVRVETTTEKNELYLQIEMKKGDIFEAISQIATKGNLQVVAATDAGKIFCDLSLKDVTPEEALQKACEAAGFDCQLKDGVWVISPMKLTTGNLDKPKIIDSMVFDDVPIVDVLSLIAQEFNVAIAIGKEVDGKLRIIKLHNKTPRQAVETLALVAGLKQEEAKDGTLILTKSIKSAAPNPGPEAPLPQQEEGPQSPFILL